MLRLATTDDAERIAELEIILFDNAFNEWTIANEIEAGAGLVVENEAGELCGYALVRFERDLVDLTRLAVRPADQGQGLGGLMLSQVVLDTRPVMLTGWKNNNGAIRLYRRFGFEIVGELEAGAWVMKRHPMEATLNEVRQVAHRTTPFWPAAG